MPSATQLEDMFVDACLSEVRTFDRSVARYMSRARLARLLFDILSDRTDASVPKLVSSARALLEHIERRKLVVPIGSASQPKDRPYWLRLRGGNPRAPNPFELATSIASESSNRSSTPKSHSSVPRAESKTVLFLKPDSH